MILWVSMWVCINPWEPKTVGRDLHPSSTYPWSASSHQCTEFHCHVWATPPSLGMEHLNLPMGLFVCRAHNVPWTTHQPV